VWYTVIRCLGLNDRSHWVWTYSWWRCRSAVAGDGAYYAWRPRGLDGARGRDKRDKLLTTFWAGPWAASHLLCEPSCEEAKTQRHNGADTHTGRCSVLRWTAGHLGQRAYRALDYLRHPAPPSLQQTRCHGRWLRSASQQLPPGQKVHMVSTEYESVLRAASTGLLKHS